MKTFQVKGKSAYRVNVKNPELCNTRRHRFNCKESTPMKKKKKKKKKKRKEEDCKNGNYSLGDLNFRYKNYKRNRPKHSLL